MNKCLNATLSIDGVRMKPFSVVESNHVADTEDEEGWTEYLVKVYNKECRRASIEKFSRINPDATKPPLGAAPYWIAIPARIGELAEAINRCKHDWSGNSLAKWAEELCGLIKLKETLDETEAPENRGIREF